MRLTPRPRPLSLLALSLCALAGARQAEQPATPPAEPAPAPAPAPANEADRPTRLEDIPPQVRVGLRAAIIARRLPVRSTVVIVPDAGAFVEAIAAWTTESRFPILIDDGTDAAREDIGRFIREFGPKTVLAWDGGATARAFAGLPADGRRARADTALAAAWDTPSGGSLEARWKELGFEPPGAVFAGEKDPAWTGALALAAGRGEPLLWIDRAGPESLGGVLGPEELAAWKTLIDRRLESTGYSWRAMGDMIEAVTLGCNVPTKVLLGGQTLALTDCLGRIEGEASNGKMVPRSYCVGIAAGDEARSACRAMCSLFLRPRKAWIVEGYAPDATDPKKAGFTQYAIAPAVDTLTKAGFEVVADDEPRDALGAWRRRVSTGVDAGLIHVNSSGARDWFMLKTMHADANDVPAALERPALVHFIHSFSAQDLADENSIAARWLDAGAYAYVGSVDEPFLTAFHTPEHFVQRLLAGAPLGFAARVDAPQPWKINVLGDPLLVMPTSVPGAPLAQAPRLTDPPKLEGAAPTADRLKDALKDHRLDDAVRQMVMLGRDADVLRLFNSAKGEKAVSPALASAAFWAASRSGMTDILFDAYNRLDDERARSQRVADALWQGGRLGLEGAPTQVMIDALKGRLRPATLPDDAVALAKAIRKVQGADAAREFCNALVSAIPDQAAREKLQERLRIF